MIDPEFSEPVTVENITLGFRNDRGEWQPGGTATTETRASIEPMPADAIQQIPAGARLADTRIFYLDDAIPAFVGGGESQATATTIIHKGERYRAATIEEWGEFKKVIATRITP